MTVELRPWGVLGFRLGTRRWRAPSEDWQTEATNTQGTQAGPRVHTQQAAEDAHLTLCPSPDQARSRASLWWCRCCFKERKEEKDDERRRQLRQCVHVVGGWGRCRKLGRCVTDGKRDRGSLGAVRFPLCCQSGVTLCLSCLFSRTALAGCGLVGRKAGKLGEKWTGPPNINQ
jgi:hypothetical protein